MSKKIFSAQTAEERAAWAQRVKKLRKDADLSQAELARDAGTSRATIINIEKGLTPQLDTLKRVLTVLGVETETVRFEENTELWLTTMGTLIEAIPTSTRQKHVDKAILTLAEGVQESANNVTPINVGGNYEDVAYQAVASTMEGGPEDEE